MCKLQFGNRVMEWERKRNVNRNGEKNQTDARIATKIGMRSVSCEDFDYNKN